MRYVGLIDCNNFFVSCERVFRPSLAGKPVVVASNNEGCVVAMSGEAKSLGITRGLPLFQMREIVERHKVIALPGNHRLYGDLSARVMATIESIVPDIEVYSIDEAFIHFPAGATPEDVESIGREIVTAVRRHVGIPTSMGIATTKTLAKAAARVAKQNPAHRAVYFINSEQRRRETLAAMPVGAIWGIGRRLVDKLKKVGIEQASDFADTPPSAVERLLNVVGQRTWRELNGEPCVEKDPEAATKKQICTTRTFSPSVSSLEKLRESITRFMENASRKLRKQHSVAKGISVFIQTNSYRKELPQYCNSAYRMLDEPTGDQLTLVKTALDALSSIYREGLLYRRAGVIITETIPLEGVQPSLFSSVKEREKRRRLNLRVDRINSNPMMADKIHLAIGLRPHPHPGPSGEETACNQHP